MNIGVNKYMSGLAIQATRRTFAYNPTQLAVQHVTDKFKSPVKINEGPFISAKQASSGIVEGLCVKDSIEGADVIPSAQQGLFVFEYPTKYPQPSYGVKERLSPLETSRHLIEAFEKTEAPLMSTLPLTLPLYREEMRNDLRNVFHGLRQVLLQQLRGIEAGEYKSVMLGYDYTISMGPNSSEGSSSLPASVGPNSSEGSSSLPLSVSLPIFEDQLSGLSEYQKEAYKLARGLFGQHVLLNGIYNPQKYDWVFTPMVGANDEVMASVLSRNVKVTGAGEGHVPVRGGSLLDKIVWETLNMDEKDFAKLS